MTTSTDPRETHRYSIKAQRWICDAYRDRARCRKRAVVRVRYKQGHGMSWSVSYCVAHTPEPKS